jgi:hypothetical protein
MPVMEATRRISGLVEIVEGIAAAADLDHRAHDFRIVHTRLHHARTYLKITERA